jgi:hypothetical protein
MHSKKSSIASQLEIKCMAVGGLMNELNFLKYIHGQEIRITLEIYKYFNSVPVVTTIDII